MLEKLNTTVVTLSRRTVSVVKEVCTQTCKEIGVLSGEVPSSGISPCVGPCQPVRGASAPVLSLQSDTRAPPVDGSVRTRPSRVLLLADDQGRGMAARLVRFFGRACEVETIFKPGACAFEVMTDAPALVKHFGDDDYLVVLAGTNDIINNKKFKYSQYEKVIKHMSHTNTILLSVPYRALGSSYNDEVYNFNKSLYNYYARRTGGGSSNIFFCDVNTLFGTSSYHRGVHLSQNEKTKLSKYLFDIIVYIKSLNSVDTWSGGDSNLIRVTTSEDFMSTQSGALRI